MNWEAYGLVAGAVVCAGFLPQIWKGYKTKHLNDMSYGMTFLLTTGFAMWLVYGINKNAMAIVATNGVAIMLNLILMAMKYSYTKASGKA